MIRKIAKVLLAAILFLILAGALFNKYYAESNKHRLKLAYRMLFTPFSEIQEEYGKMDCKNLTDREKSEGFEALVTAYCRPASAEYESRQDFLCAVGLNCSCPEGRNLKKDCHSSSLSWSSCLDFDETKTAYCHQTADQSSPEAGQVAADWSCFPKQSKITIDGVEYQVTDKGSAITGRRFDIWVDQCRETDKKTGIYSIKIK